jgi:hypothetical protein
MQVGFKALCAPLGKTGHFGCDSYFALDLQPARGPVQT